MNSIDDLIKIELKRWKCPAEFNNLVLSNAELLKSFFDFDHLYYPIETIKFSDKYLVFVRFSKLTENIPRIAYLCGYCNMVVMGHPKIEKENRRKFVLKSEFISYKCRNCNETMYEV